MDVDLDVDVMGVEWGRGREDIPRMNPSAPLMRSKMEAIRDWKRLKTDWKAERMVLKIPERISKKELRRCWRPEVRPMVAGGESGWVWELDGCGIGWMWDLD